mmetsp:Transcript_83665/g.202926  ORF Transcript_83665/g.202926 Transcript_83665/m.202926 type:complete len:291 (-) Transcript_83665:557-1429(-)
MYLYIPYPPLESALLDSLLLPMAMPNLLKSITTCFVLVVAALLIPLELRPKDSKMSETDTLRKSVESKNSGLAIWEKMPACTRSGGVVEKKCSNSQPSTASLMACTMTSFMPAPKRLPAAASFSARASAFCDILSASSFLPSFRLPELCLVSFRLPALRLLPLKPPPCSMSAGVSTMSFRPAFIGLSRSVCSPLSGFRLRFGLVLRGVLLESPPLESPSETRMVTSENATAALLSVENRCSPALRLAFGLPSVSLAMEAGLYLCSEPLSNSTRVRPSTMSSSTLPVPCVS